MSDVDPRMQLLRHTVATLAYRAEKALRGAPADFVSFRAAPDSRSAGEILAHMGDLFEWGIWMARGEQRWEDTPVLPWEQGVARFFDVLGRFDQELATNPDAAQRIERMFQGPIADALTHTGQINLLRRLAGGPVRGENYSKARIAPGQLVPDADTPRVEFD